MKKLPPFVKKPRFLLGMMWRILKSPRVKFLDDPTREWVRDPSLELVVDLEKGRLCGTGPGEPVDKLAFLGPCEGFTCLEGAICVDGEGKFIGERSEGSHVIDYGSMGLSIHFGLDARIKFFSLTFIPDETEPSVKPFSGSFLHFDSTFPANELSDVEGVMNVLGKPNRDVDFAGMGWTRSEENPYGNPSSRDLEYVFGDSTCSFSFDENNLTSDLGIMPKFDENPTDTTQSVEK